MINVLDVLVHPMISWLSYLRSNPGPLLITVSLMISASVSLRSYPRECP